VDLSGTGCGVGDEEEEQREEKARRPD